MSVARDRQIGEIVELLKPGRAEEARQRPARYAEAERRVAAFLDGSSKDRLALLMAMIGGGVADQMLALDLVSYLDEDDLPALVVKALSSSTERGEDDLLDHVALQRPDLVPRQHLAE